MARRKKIAHDFDERSTVLCAAVEAPERGPKSTGSRSKLWILSAISVAALIAAFTLYRPALAGPFLFDDFGLPFYLPSFADNPLKAWLTGVRPLLMLSYWFNFQVSARDPWTYHALNVLVHAANSVLVFFLLSRLLRLQAIEARRAVLCASIGSFLFLVHPLQTEAVAYIAGRSELICGFFVLAALTVYCDPQQVAVKGRKAALVLFLYCCAVLSKEQAVVLPAVFLIIDIVFRRNSLKGALHRGRRLYVPIVVVATFATVAVLGLLARSFTAGFNVPGIQWYEYLFTQFRVWLLYIGLALVPFRQNADYDIALSHSIGDHGSAIALAILGIIAFVAWLVRKRFPMLFGGLLIFAILLAPASSLVPLQDLAAERRMYIPLFGLLLILMQALARIQLTGVVTAALVAYVLICSALTYERAKVWGSDIAFWEDIVAASPKKARGYTHLTYAYIRSQRCNNAVKTAEGAPEFARNTPELLGMLGHAYACEARLPEAVNAFERALLAGPGVGRYLALASTYRRAGRLWDAEAAERQAMKIPPRTSYDFTMLEAFKSTMEQSRSRSSASGTVRSGH
jgi:protein O-mannosyl-transferase